MQQEVIDYIKKRLPDISIISGDSFSWSPSTGVITYKNKLTNPTIGVWALLHEAAHALKKHSNYRSDAELLRLEVEAWAEAKSMAEGLKINIDDDHIQDCLDTYRDWLHRRSTCPNCGVVSLQISPTVYKCHNCHTEWSVTSSRFCRSYRLKLNKSKRKRSPFKAATFS